MKIQKANQKAEPAGGEDGRSTSRGAGVTSSLLVCRICFLLQTCSSAAATKSSTAADPTLLISVVRRVCEMCRV